jgi:hypothetical protein
MSQPFRPAATPSLLGLEQQVRELQLRLNDLLESLTVPQHAPPARLIEGTFAFADGTYWDPGSGRGLYQYVSGSWVKL